MVCTERLYEEEIEKLDQQIRSFANKRSAFTRSIDTVSSRDDAMVSVITREVEKINALADTLLDELKTVETGVIEHKKEHMVAWAKNGLPEGDDDDFRGVRLGEAMENVIKVRREAITAAKNAQLRKIPVIVQHVDDVTDVVTEEELLKLAVEARKQR
jgi:hypothetical protein